MTSPNPLFCLAPEYLMNRLVQKVSWVVESWWHHNLFLLKSEHICPVEFSNVGLIPPVSGLTPAWSGLRSDFLFSKRGTGFCLLCVRGPKQEACARSPIRILVPIALLWALRYRLHRPEAHFWWVLSCLQNTSTPLSSFWTGLLTHWATAELVWVLFLQKFHSDLDSVDQL